MIPVGLPSGRAGKEGLLNIQARVSSMEHTVPGQCPVSWNLQNCYLPPGSSQPRTSLLVFSGDFHKQNKTKLYIAGIYTLFYFSLLDDDHLRHGTRAGLQRICIRDTWYELLSLKVCCVVVSSLGYPKGKNSLQAEPITPPWSEKPWLLHNYDHAQICGWQP